MRSAYYYGQRKRKTYDSQSTGEPLRLLGGAGRGGRGRGRGRGRGGHVVGPVADHRAVWHGTWDQAARIEDGHFYMEDVGGWINPPDTGVAPRITSWGRAWEEQYYPWRTGPGDVLHDNGILDIDEEAFNDLGVHTHGPTFATPFRAREIERLQERGSAFAALDGQLVAGIDNEARWAFLGIANNPTMGPAWTTFYYGLTDLYIGGFATASEICGSIMMICEDIINLTSGGQRDFSHARTYVFLEGITTPGVERRDYVYCNHSPAIGHGQYGQTLNSLSQDPTAVLEAMLMRFVSETEFLFHRAYVHVLTNLGLQGNSLQNMPPNMKKMRDGPFFKGIKGFHPIDDSESDSCGLDAIVWALANALRRIEKMCKKAEKAVPSLCYKFASYRRRLHSKKGTTAKLLAAETKAELASYVGWKKGESITHEQIIEMVTQYSRKYGLDLGVVIFDALFPLQKVTVSYDNMADKIPEEILCLIHWPYPGASEDSSSLGHYDCIDRTNITRWIMVRSGGPKTMKFSFRRLSLLTTTQSDEKGEWCEYCKHWQKSHTNYEWSIMHGGQQISNNFKCLDCGVLFRSLQCEELHKKRAHGLSVPACQAQNLCAKCGKVHKVDADCATFYCLTCNERVPVEDKKHVCFLSYISGKKCERLPKILYADMEASRSTGKHEAVNIAVGWTCICDAHAVFFKATKTHKVCKRCKAHENWGWFCDACLRENELEISNDCKECSRMREKYFEGPTSLMDFMEWVMTEHKGATVFFHNGGKYDLQMLMVELMSTGRYRTTSDAMRSSQIIYFTAEIINTTGEKQRQKDAVHFKDSLYFIQASLRNFNSMFKLGETDKGRFPYDLLNKTDWQAWDGKCPPPSYFGITKLEVQNKSKLAITRKKEIDEILNYIGECNRAYELKGESWNALEKLKYYTLQDVRVLHDGCEYFRRQFWELLGTDPFNWVTLPSAIAGSYRQMAYMKPKSIQIFNIPDREWQHQGLRGGRCEAFKLYWKKTRPTEEFKWFDINSEYPYVQAFGYYPKGEVTLDLKYTQFTAYSLVAKTFFKKTGISLEKVLHDPSGELGCGLIECEFRSASDAMYPIIPSRVKGKQGYVKNLYMNRTGQVVLYITVLAEAVKAGQVILLAIKRIQFWKNTTDKLFKHFICKIYASKVEASGWEKILNKKYNDITEEEKDDFITESAKMGIKIDEKTIEDNPGKRSTSKLMNNCGWGYLSKKAGASENHFFDNYSADEVEDMCTLLSGLESDQDPRRMIGCPVGVGQYTRVRTDKKAADITRKEMDKNVAYHVGGQVPAYGLQLLSTGLLTMDPSQPAYCDTDSIGFIYDSENKDHTLLQTGPYLGDWVDEYPEWDITEFCSTGCKSYYIMMVNRKDPSKVSFKGRFKGIPFGSASFSLVDGKGDLAKLGMDEMKNLVFEAIERIDADNKDREDLGFQQEKEVDELAYEFHYLNVFKRNPDYSITSRKEKKTARFTYDKRKIIIPEVKPGWRDTIKEINTLPLDDLTSNLTQEGVREWWKERMSEIIVQ